MEVTSFFCDDSGKPAPLERRLAELGETFVATQTRSRCAIETASGEKFLATEPLPFDGRLMGLMAKTKRDAKPFAKGLKDWRDYSYLGYGFNRMYVSSKCARGSDFSGAQIDVSACYWQMARKHFLSDDAYEYGLAHKAARLKALGSLATRKEVRRYEKGVLVSSEVLYPETRSVFFFIASEAEAMIAEAKRAARSAFGHWVDCVFVGDSLEGEDVARFFDCKGFGSVSENRFFSCVRKHNSIYLRSKKSSEEDSECTEYFCCAV